MKRERPSPTKTIAQCRESGRVGALKGGFHCVDEGAGRELAAVVARMWTERRMLADKLAEAEADVRRLAGMVRGLDAALAILEPTGGQP